MDGPDTKGRHTRSASDPWRVPLGAAHSLLLPYPRLRDINPSPTSPGVEAGSSAPRRGSDVPAFAVTTLVVLLLGLFYGFAVYGLSKLIRASGLV